MRILTISDIFAALIEARTYKPTMPREKAYEILVGMNGKLELPLVRGLQGGRAEEMNGEASQASPRFWASGFMNSGLGVQEFSLNEMVGARGFEPPTPSLPD